MGKYATAKVESTVDVVTGVHAPPPTGIEYAFQMPVLFEENRKRDSSAEKPAARTPVTFMNCSIVYCFDGRALAVADGADCA